MNFFCTKNHYDQWCAEGGGGPDVYGLSLAEAVDVARQLFGLGDV